MKRRVFYFLVRTLCSALIYWLFKTSAPWTLSLLGWIVKICSLVLTFESVNEILWCDHLNETSLAVLLHGNISQHFTKWNLGFSWILVFGTLGTRRANLILFYRDFSWRWKFKTQPSWHCFTSEKEGFPHTDNLDCDVQTTSLLKGTCLSFLRSRDLGCHATPVSKRLCVIQETAA